MYRVQLIMYSTSCRGKMIMQETVNKNLLQIQEDITPYKPNIIAVTKYFDETAIIEAYNAGLRNFAEARVIEAVEKIQSLPAEIRESSKFHFIGHLQTNKVKKVVANFDYIHSVDSLKLAKAVSDEAQIQEKVQNILLQINIAQEEQKYGFFKDEIYEIFTSINELPAINIAGLMNMTPLGADESELKKLFQQMADLKNDLEKRFDCELRELSMGMSQDYKTAVKYGATMLRIGRKLFK